MSIAIVDFTNHPYTSTVIKGIQEAACEMSREACDVVTFVDTTLNTLFNILQRGYTPVNRDVAEAILLNHADKDFYLGRHGVRELTSAWAHEHFPKAKYEILITLIQRDQSVAHTIIIYI
jgi:hypothetical protein